jgi:phage-related minor tail protein
MSENGEIKGVVSINADPAVQGFQKVEDAGKKAAQSLEKSAQNAAKGIAGIGDGASEASKKIGSETGRIAAAIQRQTLALQAGGKATADYYEAFAKTKGVNVDALRPQLEALRAIESQQLKNITAFIGGEKALAASNLGAKQLAASLRQVPAQFTDIVVSLQGGQAPLTVLLQQGGQLKDVFGGVGNAARALGGYVLGLVNPFTVAAAAIGAIALAYEKGAKEQREFEKTLILTGKAAGVTAVQLSDISARIDQFSGATQGKAAEALNVFANAGIKGASNLERFTATAIEFERAGGGALETVAENFAKLGKDPLKASIALNDSTNFLTRSLYEQIKALEDQGKATEAAKVAQEAYNAALVDRTPQLVQNLGLIERGWNAIKDATKGAYDAALNVGRAQTPTERLDAARRNLAFDQKAGPSIYGSDRLGDFNKRIDEQKSLIYGMEEMARLESKSLTIKQQQAAEVKALAEYDKLKDQYLDKQVQKEREIAKARELARAAGKEIDASVLAGINKKYEEKAEKAKDPTDSPVYKEALRAAKLRQELRIKENEEIAAFYLKQEEIQRQSFAKIDEQALKQAAEMFASADKIRAQADAQEDANKAYGKGKSALQELTLAQLEKTKADLQSTDRVIPGVIDAIDQQIEAQRRLIDATRAGESLDYGKKQAEEAAKAFEKMQEDAKRAAESINNSLTDAIMRGFENGKGFAENFRDTIKNMFKTLILRPVISAVVNPVSQGITGLLSGSPGSAGGAGGIGNLGGLGGLIGGGISSFTAGFQGAGLAAGLAGPTTLGAGGLTGFGAALGASPFAGALSALGTAMPYIGAALALYSVFKEKKTPHLGSAVNANIFGATTDRTDYLAGNFNGETDNALRFLTLGSVGSLNKLDRAFGGSGDFSANAKFAADNKDASAADATIFRGSQEIAALFGEGYKLYTKDAGEAFKQFTQDFDGLTLQAIKSLNNVPTYVKAEFDKLGDSATTEGIGILVDQIGIFQGQLENMKLAIGSLGSVSDEALASIIANVGGIQQFSSAVDAYYQNFFTETERLAFSTSQLSNEFTRLGVTMPTSREEFRDLTESIDKTSESGQKLYAGLLSLAGSFAAVVPAAEEAKAAVGAIVQEVVASVQTAAQAASFTPLPSTYGSFVQDGRTFTTGNLNDLARAANTTSSAIVSATDAFSGFGDAITNEIKRIRGEITGGSANGQAASLAQFATLTAQARAGGIDALKDLPSASQAYLDLVKENAGSQLEIRRAQGYVLGSLEQTQQTLGLAPVSGTAAPVVYQGASGQSAPVSFESMLQELRRLREEVASLREAGDETAANTKSAADNLEGIASGRKVIQTEAA